MHIGQLKLHQQLCFCCEDRGPSLQATGYCSAVLCAGLKSSEARDWRGAPGRLTQLGVFHGPGYRLQMTAARRRLLGEKHEV